MDTLSITLEEVSQTAVQLRAHNTQLNEYLQDIYRCMNQLMSEWQSPAATTIQMKFQGMLPVFDRYHAVVEDYAKFLDQSVTTYQTMESRLNTRAETFQ